LNFDSQAS